VNVQLLVAGCLALVGAAVHELGGEVLVVRRLTPELLPSSPFGGPVTTKAWPRTDETFVSGEFASAANTATT
jgi:hypothetical protein